MESLVLSVVSILADQDPDSRQRYRIMQLTMYLRYGDNYDRDARSHLLDVALVRDSFCRTSSGLRSSVHFCASSVQPLSHFQASNERA